MVKRKTTKRGDKPVKFKGGSPDCPCKLYINGQAVQCEHCGMWWHSTCANLTGLNDESLNMLEQWNCPNCFRSPHMKVDFSPANCGVMIDMMVEKMVESAPVVAADLHNKIEESLKLTVKNTIEEKIEAVVNDTVEKSVNATVTNTEEKVDEVMKKVEEGGQKSWSQFFKNKENTEERKQELKDVVTEVVAVNQHKMVRDAISKSRVIQNIDFVEREKRKRNVVIKNVPESKKSTRNGQLKDDWDAVMDILEELDVTESDIKTVIRAGPQPGSGSNRERRTPRPIVVTLVTPELANELHDHGNGTRVKVNDAGKEDSGKIFWINPDLIQADREAEFKAREKKREIEKARRDAHKRATERKDTTEVPVPEETATTSEDTTSTDADKENKDTDKEIKDKSANEPESFC